MRFAIVALTLADFPATATAQEVALTTPQREVVMYEPVFLQVTCKYDRTPEEPPSLALLMEGEVLDLVDGTRDHPVFETEASGSSRTYSCFWYMHRAPSLKGYIFPAPGEYLLSARDRKTGAISKELRVIVREGTDADRAVGMALVGSGPYEEKMDKLRNEVLKYPHSRLTRYAKYHLLQHDIRKVPPIERNAPEELAAVRAFHAKLLADYGELATQLPSPSDWHCEASIQLAGCKAGIGDAVGARQDLLKLEETYGKHPIYGKGLRNWIESLEKQLGLRPQ